LRNCAGWISKRAICPVTEVIALINRCRGVIGQCLAYCIVS
jgi:hypothetical protein